LIEHTCGLPAHRAFDTRGCRMEAGASETTQVRDQARQNLRPIAPQPFPTLRWRRCPQATQHRSRSQLGTATHCGPSRACIDASGEKAHGRSCSTSLAETYNRNCVEDRGNDQQYGPQRCVEHEIERRLKPLRAFDSRPPRNLEQRTRRNLRRKLSEDECPVNLDAATHRGDSEACTANGSVCPACRPCARSQLCALGRVNTF
jgi:hypothetical protein